MSQTISQEDAAILLAWDALRDDLGRQPTFREAKQGVTGGNDRLLRLFRQWTQDQVTLQEMRALVPDRCMQLSERLVASIYRSIYEHIRSNEEHYQGELETTRLELEAETEGRRNDAKSYEDRIKTLQQDLAESKDNVKRLNLSLERLTIKLMGEGQGEPALPDAA